MAIGASALRHHWSAIIVSPRLETVSSSSSPGLHGPLEDFDQIEQELHRLFVVAEREALG